MITQPNRVNALEILDNIEEIDPYVKFSYDFRNNTYCVHSRVEIGGDGILRSVSGRALTPEDAIFDLWYQLTNIESDQYVVIDASGENRAAYKWNGKRWVIKHEKQVK